MVDSAVVLKYIYGVVNVVKSGRTERHARVLLSGIQNDGWQLTLVRHWIPANNVRE